MSTIVETLHTLNSASVDLSWQIKYCSKLHQSNVLRVAKYQGPGSQPQDWSDCGWKLRLWVWVSQPVGVGKSFEVVDSIEWKFSHWILSVPLPLKREDLIKTRPIHCNGLTDKSPFKESIATYTHACLAKCVAVGAKTFSNTNTQIHLACMA